MLLLFIILLTYRDVHGHTKPGVIMSDLNQTIPESLADKLFNEVKVLCFVNTWPANHKTRAKAVKETWSTRCNKVLFMSTLVDPELDTVALPVKDGRKHLWSKIKSEFTYIYKNFFDKYDWFLKADDDTYVIAAIHSYFKEVFIYFRYVIMENLRYMLYKYDKQTPIYFGCKFKPFVRQGYMSGGAGYVLSKESLRRFVKIGIPDENYCKQEDGEMDDVELGVCLEKLNVTAGDTRDWNGKGRMFPFDPNYFLFDGPPQDDWYSIYAFYPTNKGRNCCSERTISFHYINPEAMYALDFLIYELEPFGLQRNEYVLPKKYGTL